MPAGVEPAPLRCPEGKDLISRAWWAFGFPDRDPVGDSADGQVGASLSYGWVRLDTGSRYLIRPGFSGGGLWSQDYEAVVGVVGQAHANGDGRAITLHQADLDFPGPQAGGAGQLVGSGSRGNRPHAVGLDPGPRPRRGAALAAAGPRGEHRKRARLAVPRPHGGAQQDRVAGWTAARPTGGCW